MTFPKFSIKTQLILAIIFTPLNFFLSYFCTYTLKWALFMDMVFVYSASFFGIPCGIFVGFFSTLINAIFIQHTPLHLFYAICSITGCLLTLLFVNGRKIFSWVNLALLAFISTFIISLEGSIIYAIFFAGRSDYTENTSVLYLTYTLIMQNLGTQLSAFLARLPVNLFDKTIAVFSGFGIYVGVRKILEKKGK